MIQIADLVVLGQEEFVLGFKLVGIERIYTVGEKPEREVKQLMQDSTVGVIVTDEDTVGSISQSLRKEIETSVKPITVVLSEKDTAQDNLREMIKKSIGVDLLNA
ncbi:V-type ATP synthase subunit F [Candidatus Woesearchaeota archaeon]|nr:V-type ATP synthase subunit F [Candidatus Woesearchaeota archaeon]